MTAALVRVCLRALSNAAAPFGGAAPPLTWGLGSGGCFLQAGLGWLVLPRWNLGHALGGEHAPTLELPVLVMFQQRCAPLPGLIRTP